MKIRTLLSFCLLIPLVSCSQKKYNYCFVGGRLEDDFYQQFSNANSLFSLKNMYSSTMLSLIEDNGLDVKTNVKINNVIKNSKKVIVYLGESDLLKSCVNGKIDTNSTSFYNNLELFNYYLYETIINIKEINSNIYVISLFKNYSIDYKNAIEYYNYEIREICENTNSLYIDIPIEKQSSIEERNLYLYEYIK